MFLTFFNSLKKAGVPVTPREYLALIQAMDRDLANEGVDQFYFLARAILVKDEGKFDKFDRVFAAVFRGIGSHLETSDQIELPEEWLRKLAEGHLSDAEKKAIQALGWEKLMETLRQRLAEQKSRHQGGGKWIGTAGTSPFGAYGHHPQGVRIGQEGGRNHRAVKVWDRRDYKDLDGDVGLGVRNLKIALRRLRKFARTGAADELDLEKTIHDSAHAGYLDIRMRPERRNAIKVLLFLDVGGSMDWHVSLVERLFSAARSEFKHMQHFYFHNCLYEGVWKSNSRRFVDRTLTPDVLRTFPHDYKVVFVGDASMSPYEITMAGGAVEYTNEEPGAIWMERVTRAYPHCVWLNPVPEQHWAHTESIDLIRKLMSDRMYPLTLAGIDAAMRRLVH